VKLAKVIKTKGDHTRAYDELFTARKIATLCLGDDHEQAQLVKRVTAEHHKNVIGGLTYA
jgi:hypothetical protein